jgi:hypothetical protein
MAKMTCLGRPVKRARCGITGGSACNGAEWAVIFDTGHDAIETFRQDLAALRQQVGAGPRSPVEEDIQRLSNRRFHLLRDFASEKRQIEAIVAEHHTLSPQLKLRVLGTA